MPQRELYPDSNQLGKIEQRGNTAVVAYDRDGERYCVECAREMDSIDCERFHERPRTVPHGGSVSYGSLAETTHTDHCGNVDCGKEIPAP